MKCFALAVAILIGQASAQTLVEKPFIMRSEAITADGLSGITRICVLVLPDGRYRMERSFDGTGETKVFINTLPPDDLKNLQAVLDNHDLQQIKTAPISDLLNGRVIYGLEVWDVLSLSIPRDDALQKIEFLDVNQWKPFPKVLIHFSILLRRSKNERSLLPRMKFRTTVRRQGSCTSQRSPPDQTRSPIRSILDLTAPIPVDAANFSILPPASAIHIEVGALA
jgi:hypothetical protein